MMEIKQKNHRRRNFESRKKKGQFAKSREFAPLSVLAVGYSDFFGVDTQSFLGYMHIQVLLYECLSMDRSG